MESAAEDTPVLTELPSFTDAASAIRALGGTALIQAVMLAGWAAAVMLSAGRLPALDALMREGAAGLVGAGLTISLTGTLCCRMLAWGRRRSLAPAEEPVVPRSRIGRMLHRMRGRPRAPVTRLAGWPQALLLLAGSAVAAWLLWRFPAGPVARIPVGLAGLLLLPAFLLMVCEHIVAAVPGDRLPEGMRLAALLRVPVLVLLVLAGLAAAQSFGVTPPGWIITVLAALLLVVAAELALRTLGIWFLPLPAPEKARAAIGSVVASVLQPGGLRPSGIAQRLRGQLGIDISRSWAVAYARSAAPPVALFLLLVAWGISGVTRIELGQRGAYERFGAPAAVLKPGLHMVLPWPFGRVRAIEYGVVHAVMVGAAPGTAAAADTSTADGDPPSSANRLWDDAGGSDMAYLIASRSGTRESFETVSAGIRVLYRIGLDDASAQRALYSLADPDGLVRSLSGGLLARFFAARTLTEVLGARREQVADQLRSALQAQLDARHSGLEVVSLVVEAMHPPGGAAQAYRSVQAAQITASTRIAEERGMAQGTLSMAARDAHDAEDNGQATAAEVVSAARADRTRSDADALAYKAGGEAFLLERYLGILRQVLAKSPLEIVDHRLQRQDASMFDLRSAVPFSGGPNQ